MDFSYFDYGWLGWGLYLSTLYYHDIDFSETEIPYDYIADYEFSELDTDKRLYGGEIGAFHEVEHNVEMLHKIYMDLPNKPVIDTSNPLYNDIVNGDGTSGIDWYIQSIQKGIFNYDELPTIQSLLTTQEGINVQFDYLIAHIYHLNNVWAVRWIETLPVDNRAKCLLACFLYRENNFFFYWLADIEGMEDLQDVATEMLNLIDESEEINAYYEYILDNLTNEELG